MTRPLLYKLLNHVNYHMQIAQSRRFVLAMMVFFLLITWPTNLPVVTFPVNLAMYHHTDHVSIHKTTSVHSRHRNGSLHNNSNPLTRPWEVFKMGFPKKLLSTLFAWSEMPGASLIIITPPHLIIVPKKRPRQFRCQCCRFWQRPTHIFPSKIYIITSYGTTNIYPHCIRYPTKFSFYSQYNCPYLAPTSAYTLPQNR